MTKHAKTAAPVGTLHLGPHAIKVREVPSLLDEAGEQLHGCWDEDNLTITINDSDPPDVKAATLLHEKLHAVSDIYCLGLDEQTIVTLEVGLYQMGTR